MATTEEVQSWLQVMALNDSYYGATIADKLKVVKARPGAVVFELLVDGPMLNFAGSIHGGLLATLVDECTTFAIMSAGHKPGLSVDITVQYLSTAKEGETISVAATLDKAGHNMAFARCVVGLKGSDKIIATGSHTKFLNVKL
ncbi:acyl-CoA thioesterase 13-like protein [Fimicolochytrium jonesii]|uniref:acyl-CoA thioesterase 13-like protein n=1 Tax=Fimicolochytrium jonesii TaxID=1396493 RepID=UPI0022FEB168|nr:acyl-CoA thioesterase 13-like protein [Fimicolochytrium jonesii]KAI8817096.1 acyl-CoA thioesterase 13-like protein [Fimicolochytrium jonesii]